MNIEQMKKAAKEGRTPIIYGIEEFERLLFSDEVENFDWDPDFKGGSFRLLDGSKFYASFSEEGKTSG